MHFQFWTFHLQFFLFQIVLFFAGLLCLCKHLPPHFISSDKQIKDKYYPIEIDPKLTPEEKTPYMQEWYSESEKLWNGIEFDLKELHQVVEQSGPELRDGTIEFCKY